MDEPVTSLYIRDEVYPDLRSALTAAGLSDSFAISGEVQGAYRLTTSQEDGDLRAAGGYPIGLLGWAKAGLEADRRISRSVIVPAGALPSDCGELPAGGWQIIKGKGSLSFALRATVGYDVLGLDQLLGGRIADAFESLIGCKIDDEYLSVLNREGSGEELRLRLFRARAEDSEAGVNLAVGLLPGQALPLPNAAVLMTAALQPQVAAQVAAAIPQLMRANLAASYESGTTDTALLDATFDWTKPEARAAFEGGLDAILRGAVAGVKVNDAVLTHGLSRRLQVQIHLPFFEAKAKKVRQSSAALQAQESAGRVLVYAMQSEDRWASERFRSELAVLSKITVENGRLNLEGLSTASVAYRTRAVSGSVFSEHDVTLPGSVLAAWFEPRSKAELAEAAQRASRALQVCLKTLVPQVFFADEARLRQNATTAPLLVWAALPPSPKIYWDWRSAPVRAGLMRDPRTIATLRQVLARWDAEEFLGSCLQLAAAGQGSELLQSLLYTESQLVWGAKKALDKLTDISKEAASAPTKMLRTLAAFGDQITSAFHRSLSVYCAAPETKWWNSLLFVAASRALAGDGGEAVVRSTLTRYFLRENSSFRAGDFLNGATPPPEELTATQVTSKIPALPGAADAY